MVSRINKPEKSLVRQGAIVAFIALPFVAITPPNSIQFVECKSSFCCNTNPVNDAGHERILFGLAACTESTGESAWVIRPQMRKSGDASLP